MRGIIAFLLILGLYVGIALEESSAQELQPAYPIEFEGQIIGTLTDLQFAVGDDPDRIFVSADVTMEEFADTLDRILRNQGDMDDGCDRFHWRGSTRISGTGKELLLNSEFRYVERWCGIFGASWTIGSISSDMSWKFSFVPAKLNELKLKAKVTNLHDVPGEIEDWIDAHVDRYFDVPIGGMCGKCNCDDVVQELDASLESASFSEAPNAGIILQIRISLLGDSSELLACVG